MSIRYMGVQVDFGEQGKVILPGLSTRQMRENKETIDRMVSLEREQTESGQMNAAAMFEVFDIAAKIVGLALKRNYPNITDSEIEDTIDSQNVKFLVAAVMGQSGYKLVWEVAAEPKGE